MSTRTATLTFLALSTLAALPAHGATGIYDTYASTYGRSAILLADGYGADASAGAVLGTSTSTIDVGIEAEATTSLEADLSDAAEAVSDAFSVTRATVSEFASTTANVTSAAVVETSEDLRAYVAGVIDADARIERTDLSSEAVTVVYQQPGRLFGFVPVSMTVTVTVDSSGDVTVDYPWYGFMVATEQSRAVAEATLENQMRTTLANVESAGSAAEGLSARAQAEILAELQSALSLQAEAGVGAEAQ